LEGIHTLEDETKNNYGKLVLSATEYWDDATMFSGNAYWLRSDRKTGNGDLNDEFNGAGNTNQGVQNSTSTKQDAYGANGQITFDQDWLGRRNQLIVGVALESSIIKFAQTEQEQATLLTNGFFGGALGDVEQTTGLTGKTKSAGIFATNTHSLNDHWDINTSARYNFIQVNNEDTFNPAGGNASLTGNAHYERINPSVGLTFHPNDNYTTYASYSESNRAPTSIELGCANEAQPCNLPTQMADDPPLEMVVAKTVEFGARGKIANNMSWNAAVYSGKNKDDILFVYANASNSLGYFTNVDETTRKGIDLGWNGQFDDLGLTVNYGFVMARYGSDFTIANEVNTSSDGTSIQVKDGDYLPNIPKHHIKVRANYRINPLWHVGATVSAFSKSYMMGNENQGHDSSQGIQGETPGYAVMNLDSQYYIGENWQLTLKAINIFDNEYYTGGRLAETRVQTDRSFGAEREVASLIPGAPRAAWLGLRYEF
jgi:outer membrane receptor protein involved in Fe transport